MTAYQYTMDWPELLEKMQRPCSLEDDERSSRSSEDTHGEHFYNGSWEDAIKYLSHGWKGSTVEVNAMAGTSSYQIMADRLMDTFETYNDTSGAMVDIGLYLAGEPECMIENRPTVIAGKGRAIRLAVDVAYPYYVDEAAIRRRGAAVIALVDLLAQAQHPLEIWAIESITPSARHGNYGNDTCTTAVRIHKASSPLAIGRVMFALGHPSFLRRCLFSFEETLPTEVVKRFGFSRNGYYGYPRQADVDGLPDEEGTTLILGRMDQSDWQHDECLDWISTQLDRIFD